MLAIGFCLYTGSYFSAKFSGKKLAHSLECSCQNLFPLFSLVVTTNDNDDEGLTPAF